MVSSGASRLNPQNIYDDPKFFAQYRALRRSESGLNAALEWPALLRLLPPSLEGRRVLDLGCGFGDFARAARLHGAREVIGIDISVRMLDEARRRTSDPAIIYIHAAIEDFDAGEDAFDLVVSSLALHYIADYTAVVRRVAAALRGGGRFAFSVEHPMCTALATGEWFRGSDGAALHWPVDRYRDEGERRTTWFVEGVIKYHRTLETYVNGLLLAGLQLVRLEEPEAVAEHVLARPELALHRRRPPFLLMAADRPVSPGAR
jgi:SAM-dependent methyltransferase